MEFKIYCNYGVLESEKRNVYTYGNQYPTATCSDEMIVRLPQNDIFTIYKNDMGELMVEAVWGWTYTINEVLDGNNRPYFCAFDKNKNGHIIYLEEV